MQSMLGGSEVHLRLRMTKGLWRLNYLTLASIGDELPSARIPPSKVLRNDTDDASALHKLVDTNAALVTMPGDHYTLLFDLPEDFESYDLFLESRGYYLEWIRDVWLAEENTGKAMQMFMQPAAFLRAEAPRFKVAESTMEEAFWNSRFSRLSW